jgi:hypothetical protein
MKATTKNYDVIIAFVIFLGCLLCALFLHESSEVIVVIGIQ